MRAESQHLARSAFKVAAAAPYSTRMLVLEQSLSLCLGDVQGNRFTHIMVMPWKHCCTETLGCSLQRISADERGTCFLPAPLLCYSWRGVPFLQRASFGGRASGGLQQEGRGKFFQWGFFAWNPTHLQLFPSNTCDIKMNPSNMSFTVWRSTSVDSYSHSHFLPCSVHEMI